MKRQKLSLSKNAKKGLLKLSGIVVGLGVIIVTLFLIAIHMDRPKVQYSAKEVNCEQAAIQERNKHLPANEDACIITLTIYNYGSKSVTLDLANISGPGFADWGGEFSIRIYDAAGEFCYAGVGYVQLNAGETENLGLICVGDSNHTKNSRDPSIDTRPTHIEIDYYGKKRIYLQPLQD